MMFRKTIFGLFLFSIFVVVVSPANTVQNKTYTHKSAAEEISDMKEFKKILRTKNNVLVCFVSSFKQSSQILRIFREVGETIKGQGTMIIVDCSGDGKKICKNLKVKPQNYMLKHYKDGDFHKDYDRRETVQSMTNFMRDPTGDIPWEEESTSDVIHFQDPEAMARFLKKESKPVMVMFYAPWCGFCKQLKPEYASAAKELKGQSILAAIDVNRPENAMVRQHYNITGFPTLLYFENSKLKYNYEGNNKKDAIIEFMRNPKMPEAKPKEAEWSDTESEVVHLNEDNFQDILKEQPSALVMFYAPWCGHCKKMKPEYEKAASLMKEEGVPGILAGVDATKNAELARMYEVRGYPTVKYFQNGEMAYDAGNVRTSDALLEFMRDPKEPPPPPPPEVPWSEEPIGDGNNVVHLKEDNFKQFLRKKKHVLVMFYAPWCGHCKNAKPEFKLAAEKFKDDSKVEFAAVDCTSESSICSAANVSGYPTIKYFHYFNKENPYSYSGERMAKDFIKFMEDRHKKSSDDASAQGVEDGSRLHSANLEQLSTDSFHGSVTSNEFTLVMFYTPDCKNCKKLAPEFGEASRRLAASSAPRIALATVNCHAEKALCGQHRIETFPTVRLFKGSAFLKDFSGDRSSNALVQFVRMTAVDKRDEL